MAVSAEHHLQMRVAVGGLTMDSPTLKINVLVKPTTVVVEGPLSFTGTNATYTAKLNGVASTDGTWSVKAVKTSYTQGTPSISKGALTPRGIGTYEVTYTAKTGEKGSLTVTSADLLKVNWVDNVAYLNRYEVGIRNKYGGLISGGVNGKLTYEVTGDVNAIKVTASANSIFSEAGYVEGLAEGKFGIEWFLDGKTLGKLSRPAIHPSNCHFFTLPGGTNYGFVLKDWLLNKLGRAIRNTDNFHVTIPESGVYIGNEVSPYGINLRIPECRIIKCIIRGTVIGMGGKGGGWNGTTYVPPTAGSPSILYQLSNEESSYSWHNMSTWQNDVDAGRGVLVAGGGGAGGKFTSTDGVTTYYNGGGGAGEGKAGDYINAIKPANVAANGTLKTGGASSNPTYAGKGGNVNTNGNSGVGVSPTAGGGAGSIGDSFTNRLSIWP